MSKIKTTFICSSCGYETARWLGKCPDCDSWNTLEENVVKHIKTPQRTKKGISKGSNEAVLIDDVPEDDKQRLTTGLMELDRVLGGGIVEGALMLVGGDPGIGKSTLLLQVCAYLSNQGKRVLYVSGEESVRQIKIRASRLKIKGDNLYLMAENSMDYIEKEVSSLNPDYVVIDSIQTMYKPELNSAPGSVTQVKESTGLLLQLAKTRGIAIFIVGHVTKEGAIAGPRILEHMVDVVMYFEGDRQHEYRILRAIKNRFGSVNELGIFQMTHSGMSQVENASETFLSMRAKGSSGSAVFCAIEGSRPLLVDIQALAIQSYYGIPRRTVNGMDQGRINLLLAVLEKRASQKLHDKDIYINVAGGLSLSERATDLAVCAAVYSSIQNKVLPQNMIIMGEVGLAGEVRAISQMERRLMESMRLGFNKAIIPAQTAGKINTPKGMDVLGVDTLAQALSVIF